MSLTLISPNVFPPTHPSPYERASIFCHRSIDTRQLFDTSRQIAADHQANTGCDRSGGNTPQIPLPRDLPLSALSTYIAHRKGREAHEGELGTPTSQRHLCLPD